MNRLFVLFFILFGLTAAQAQIHEIGVFLGGSNYVGDIGPTDYVAPNQPAFGVLYKWNRSPRHSWRISFTHAKIKSSDRDSDMASRKQRDYSFQNDIKEVSLGLEFDFFDFNIHDEKPKFTPYVYSGVSYILYKGLFFAGDQTKSDATHGSLAIPMIVGVKAKLQSHFVIGFEVGARLSMKDDLDGSNPTNKNLENLKFGNINSKDWYTFTGFTLTYTFGNRPCYCTE